MIALCAVLAPSLWALDSIVVFNEIHYHPSSQEPVEFIELHNQNSVNVELSGWRITGGVDYSFPPGTVIPGRGYLVVAQDTAALSALTGLSGLYGPYAGGLNNNGETLLLRNHNDRLMDEVQYSDRSPWPLGADGLGASLSKIDPLTNGAEASHWRHSHEIDGTPGAENFSAAFKSALTINELAGDSIGPGTFFIELSNSGATPVDLSGHVIRSEQGNQHIIPVGLVVPAGGVVAIGESELGFRPSNNDNVALYSPGMNTLLDAARVSSEGCARYPNGDDTWYFTGTGYAASSGALNPAPPESDIVINEIMYHHRPDYAEDGTTTILAAETLLDWNAGWRFNESGTDLGAEWALSSHPAGGSWKVGAGPLGYESTAGLPPVPIVTTLKKPTLNSPYVVTYYFETEFNVEAAGLANIDQFAIFYQVDDGAVFYINGHEVGRHNMPEGAVNAATHALYNFVEADAILQLSLVDPPLVAGANRLSIEVHQLSQTSTDVVMGARIVVRQIAKSPDLEYVDNDEEWVELYNRSGTAVDIGGWALDGAVQYTVPAGTVIPPDGYLVVARNAAALSAKYPAVNPIGNFQGSLSNSGEELLLLDASRNRADSVFYRDGAPWPAAADGGGSSLELRNPFIDNSAPEAWRASDNSSLSEWKNYSFTMLARTPVYTPTIYNFHELRLGLLDEGSVLLDDISVLEDPDGAALELIANPSFDNMTGWRVLGTHLDSHTVLDGGESVLKIVAVNSMSYLNNLIESNLTQSGALRPVQAETNYRISFRAKWLSGSPQLHFELYYNKLAKSVILDQPDRYGTPGERNSTYESNTGPVFHGLKHAPAVPAAGQSVEVSVAACDPDGIREVTLRYSVGEGTFAAVPMTYSFNSGTWKGIIPGQSNGSLVQFYVEGEDNSVERKAAFAPPAGPDSRAIIEFSSSAADEGKQSMRLNMRASDATAMHAPNDLLSNHRFGCTVVVNEDQIVYECGIRLRGSMFSRSNASNSGLNLKFPADQPFRGIHSTITLRKRDMKEMLSKHIITQVGGLHESYNDVVYQYGHTSSMDGWSRLEMARFGGDYLEGLPGGDGEDGTVFKMEGIRVFQTTQDGTPNSPKVPFPIGWVDTFDLADQGEDKEMYRHNLPISSNLARDDFKPMIKLCQTFSLNGQALEDAVPTVIDVDMWTRQFALMSLCGVGDVYSQGNPHNLDFYVRPSDGLIQPMPWDWDFTFSRSTSSPLWGNQNVSKIFARPVYARLYYGHLLEMIQTTFNADYLTVWFNHYASWTKENYSSHLSYVSARANYVLTQLPVPVTFAISSNEGVDFSVDGQVAEITGDGWINVRTIHVNGNPVALPVTWVDGDSWHVEVPVAPGANLITLKAFDHAGNEVGEDSITITRSGAAEPVSAYDLVISEINYNPHDPSGPIESALQGIDNNDFEFIELQNISGNVLDLRGYALAAGIQFTFSGSAVQSLEAGGFVVVVRNRAAFASRYSIDEMHIAGEYGGKLSNSGENIQLTLNGETIFDISYNDARGWPVAADGGGPSLIPNNDAVATQGFDILAYPRNWRASTYIGGSPGAVDPVLPAVIVINELAAYSNDQIELYNPTASPLTLDGFWYLSDDLANPEKWNIPSGTVISAGGWVVFNEDDFHPGRVAGFGLDKAGEVLILSHRPATAMNRVVDCIAFKGQANGASWGRYPDGNAFTQTLVPTFGTANRLPAPGIHIHELMYNPWPLAGINADEVLEYIMLTNASASAIIFDGGETTNTWRLSGGVEYSFAPGCSMAAGERVWLVPFDPALTPESKTLFCSTYALAEGSVRLLGPYVGNLSNSGERIALERPQGSDDPLHPEELSWIIVDEVTWLDEAPWPPLADGTGLALMRIGAAGNDPLNWTLTTGIGTGYQFAYEKLSPGAGTWNEFATNPNLPDIDYADINSSNGVTISVASGMLNASLGTADILINGSGPLTTSEYENFTSFSRGTAGRFQMDLQRVIPLSSINSFSWHSSTPQNQSYDIYYSKATVAPAAGSLITDLSGAGWKFLGTIQTTYDTTTPGQIGVNINSRFGGTLINARHLLWDIKAGGCLYGEFDVFMNGSFVTNYVPELWLTGYGLAATDAAALEDSDNDGLCNWEEYYAGTSPVSAESVFRITESQMAGGLHLLHWRAVADKAYSVEFNTELKATGWTTLVSGIQGVEPECGWTLPIEGTNGFIRITVE